MGSTAIKQKRSPILGKFNAFLNYLINSLSSFVLFMLAELKNVLAAFFELLPSLFTSRIHFHSDNLLLVLVITPRYEIESRTGAIVSERVWRTRTYSPVVFLFKNISLKVFLNSGILKQ